MQFKRLIVLLGLALVLDNAVVRAKDNIFQSWLDYKHSHKLSNKWMFFSDYGFRWEMPLPRDVFWRIHARPSFQFKTNALWEADAGIGLFFQNNKNSSNTFELRPWQGIKVKWPNIKRYKFVHFLRLEERQSYNLDNNGGNFVLKLRYRFGIDIPLNNKVISVGTFYIPVRAELFFDLSGTNAEATNDKFRVDTGVGYRVNQQLRLRLLYVLQNQLNNDIDGVSQIDHIIRFSVIQRFGFQ